MAKPELIIELDGEQFRFGQPITGRVKVSVPDDCKADRLIIKTAWAGAAWQVADRQTLISSPVWSAGDEHIFPFEQPAPPGPVSFKGANLEVCHAVLAQLEGDEWFIDPRARVAYELLPGPVAEVCLGDATVAVTTGPRSLKQQVTALGAGVAVVAAVLLCAALSSLHGVAGIIAAAVGGLIGYWMLASTFRDRSILRRMGHPVLAIPPVLVAGVGTEIGLTFTPVEHLHAVQIDLELRGVEGYRTPGKNSKTHEGPLPEL